MRCNGPIVWASKILKVVADSSTEAETDEASRGCKSAIFTKQVLCGAMRPAPGPVPLLGDNSAMHQLIQKDGASYRTRCYERATVFVKHAVLKLFVEPFLISTDHINQSTARCRRLWTKLVWLAGPCAIGLAMRSRCEG